MSVEIEAETKVVPLGRIDYDAVRFFKVRGVFDKARWVLGENPQQAFGFIPLWVCSKERVVGVALRDDRSNKGNLYGLGKFIFEKHRYNIEYQVSPKNEVQKAIDFHFPEKIPKVG